MDNKDMVSAFAERLSKGLYEVFCAVRDLPPGQPMTAARIGAHIDRTAVAVGLSLKRLEDMGLVRRNDNKSPPEFSIAAGDVMPRVPVYKPPMKTKKSIVGEDGLTAAQRVVLDAIRAMVAEDGCAGGVTFGAVTKRTGLPGGAVIGRIEGLVQKGFVRVWSEQKPKRRSRRMVVPLDAPVEGEGWKAKGRAAEQFGYAPLKSADMERALYAGQRYEDLPRSQRKADMINTPVPSRAANYSQIQWSGA